MDDRAQWKAGATPAYAWFVVMVLMVAYVFSFIDRQILNLLVGPIRRDLAISDTQMSLLMGFSFAIFYSLLGIPLGRAADNRSRRGLIAAGIVVWSLMTALCGTARHYAQLFLYRVGVGVGEATLSPAAYSLIADYFPPERRATAMSVYGSGIYVGSGLAFLLGGLVIDFASARGDLLLPIVGQTRPWQAVFYILGIAGLIFSAAFLLVREPPRQGAGSAAVPFGDVVAHLWRNRRAVLCHNLGIAMLAFCGYASAAWIPSFYVRTHGWDAGTVGIVYGSIVMVFGTAGVVCGGRLADRWLRRGMGDAALRVGLCAAVFCIVFTLLYPSVPDATLATIALAPAVFAQGMPFGAAPAAIQEIVPPRMRGQASAIYLLIVNLIGLGLGPTAVALVTDYVFGDDAAVRWSLLVVCTTACVLGALLLAAGLRPYRESLARMRASDGGPGNGPDSELAQGIPTRPPVSARGLV